MTIDYKSIKYGQCNIVQVKQLVKYDHENIIQGLRKKIHLFLENSQTSCGIISYPL